MSTIREWLNVRGFDWSTGRIIWQETEDEIFPGWSSPVSATEIPFTHEVLDRKFRSDGIGPECPRFVAEDATRIYFPEQYDRATDLFVLEKDISKYLDPANETPYPGG